MFKHLFVLCLFALALQIEASVDDDYKTRVEWVKDLRTFVMNLEERNPDLLSQSAGEKQFLLRFSLFEEAIASGNYDCFFAGWPSKLIKKGAKKFCQNPSRGNGEYKKGSCKTGELQCQPVIFGKDLCVSFDSPKDRSMAFSRCDSKFKAHGNFEFLKTMSAEDKEALKEVSNLAHKICVEGSVGVQKSKPMCSNLMKKFKNSVAAIDRAPATLEKPEVIDGPEAKKVVEEKKDVGVTHSHPSESTSVANADDKLIPIKIDLTPAEEVCETPVEAAPEVVSQAKQMVQTVNQPADSLYEQLKKDFQESALCRPEGVLNNPKDKLPPSLLTKLMEDMQFMVQTESYQTREWKLQRFKQLVEDFSLSDETVKYGEELLAKELDTADKRFDAMARLRGVMLQDMAKMAAKTPGYQADAIKEDLVKRGIFVENSDGSIECPFVSEQALREALAGRDEVMKSANKSKIKNPDLLTIVDYSRPSNERRMYVIDLKNKQVLHNTWVGQGGGSDRSQALGSDGKGSNPQTSNAAKSNLSSEGFYVARQASAGGVYLNNVILDGIDEANSNMASRAIVMHGWRTPNSEYVNRTWEMEDSKNGKRLPGKDVYQEFMSTDFKNTTADLFDISSDIKNAAAYRQPYIDATDGCLGVPDTKMGHADRKGRDESQLELLRDDLPGSLMFNYTGPHKTKSKYLK